MGEVRRSEEDYSTLEIFRPGIQLVQFLLYITVVRKLEQPPSAQKDPPDTLFFFGGFPDMTHVTVRRIFDDYTKNYATKCPGEICVCTVYLVLFLILLYN